MSEPIVRFRAVSKSYDGRTPVVAGLDLDIARGEFLTLLGPSGSGKTTTLMMLAGFEDPSAGSIELDGRRIDRVPPHRRGIGVVFQNYALFPHMTVAQNLAFPLSVRGTPRSEIAKLTAKALEMVRLSGFGDRRPQQLSGGQQQRVALARALIFSPSLVLMDEPLGALDKQLREELQLEIRRLHATLGVTIVYVTHDQSEALTMSDRIAVFEGGRIQQLGSAEDIYERPANAFVAGFIGENNRLEATVVDSSSLRLSDGHVLLTRAHGCSTGERVLACVRPEKVHLAEAGQAGAISAVVTEVVYLGDHCRLALKAPGLPEIVAKRPSLDGQVMPRPGEAVFLAIPPAAVMVFRA